MSGVPCILSAWSQTNTRRALLSVLAPFPSLNGSSTGKVTPKILRIIRAKDLLREIVSIQNKK